MYYTHRFRSLYLGMLFTNVYYLGDSTVKVNELKVYVILHIYVMQLIVNRTAFFSSSISTEIELSFTINIFNKYCSYILIIIFKIILTYTNIILIIIICYKLYVSIHLLLIRFLSNSAFIHKYNIDYNYML